MNYIDEGKGEIILFFHGWGLGSKSLLPAVSVLAKKYRVIAPSFPSFSHFSKNEGEIKNLLGDKKAIIVGHSSGGISAIEFANKYPNNVKSIVMIDTVGAFKNKLIRKFALKWLFLASKQLLVFNKLTLILLKDFISQLRYAPKLVNDINYVINYDIKYDLGVPVLIIWAKDDDLINIENGYNLKEIMKGAKFVETSGNHYWFLKNPRFLLEQIELFNK